MDKDKKTDYHALMKSIGREKAIALADSGWWIGKPAREIAEFQLFTRELSMPFGEFQAALETSLGRPVFTHELGLNYDGICKEFLGEAPAPTLTQIINLIPEEKRIILALDGSEANRG